MDTSRLEDATVGWLLAAAQLSQSPAAGFACNLCALDPKLMAQHVLPRLLGAGAGAGATWGAPESLMSK